MSVKSSPPVYTPDGHLDPEWAVVQFDRMVWKVAQRFKYIRCSGLEVEDFVGAGYHGIVEGCRKFDPSKGRPSTFLYCYIEGYMQRMLRKNRYDLKVPVHIHTQAADVHNITYEIAMKTGREPTPEEVSEVYNDRIRGHPKEQHGLMSPEKIEELEKIALYHGIPSWEAMREKNEIDEEMAGAVDPGYALIEDAEEFRRVIEDFDEREKDVMIRRMVYGHTLEEIAQDHHVTKERIRQIQRKCTKRLEYRYIKKREAA